MFLSSQYMLFRVCCILQGMFRPSITFFVLSILELVTLDVLGYWILYTYGTGWLPWLLSLLSLSVMQVSEVNYR